MATNMHFGATKQIFQYAEGLRKNTTQAERIIWEKVSKNQFGVRITRHHPIWNFIADFYCHELKLIIEIDGGIHLATENKEYDISRDVTLNEFGIRIIRFTNDQVLNEIDKVTGSIKQIIEDLKLQAQLNSKVEKVPFRGFRGSHTKIN